MNIISKHETKVSTIIHFSSFFVNSKINFLRYEIKNSLIEIKNSNIEKMVIMQQNGKFILEVLSIVFNFSLKYNQFVKEKRASAKKEETNHENWIHWIGYHG